jgi:anti-sigma regulatory factor (Ser/Thr protein kinase)
MRSEPITVPGTLDSLARIRAFVKTAADAAGLDKKATYRLQLAVDEIATNIVVHGYAENELAGDVTLEAEVSDSELRITLEDCATPFNPHSRERPAQLDLPLEERPIGGLGVFLAIENVDRYEYEYADGRNRNTFIVMRNRGE